MSWQGDSSNLSRTQTDEENEVMVHVSSILTTSTNIITMIKEITFKIDEDNDLYEMTVDNTTYTLDNVYDSDYGNLFDELNILIDTIQ
mgnify:CR=1 FL=1